MKQIKYFALTSLLIVCLACAGEDSSSSETGDSKNTSTEQVLHDSRIYLTRDGRTTAIIDAALIEKHFGHKETIARGITAHFYDSTGHETSWLTADSGEVIEENNRMTVWGDVEVTSDDGVKLYTEALKWDQDKNRVVNNVYNEIHRGDDILRGYGLETDRNLKEFTLKKQVSGRIRKSPDDAE